MNGLSLSMVVVKSSMKRCKSDAKFAQNGTQNEIAQETLFPTFSARLAG